MDRKILIAKRHGTRVSRRRTNSLSLGISHSVKRNYEVDEINQPLNKKPYRNSHHQYQHCSKNLAARRLENLRTSLAANKQNSVGTPSPITGTSGIASSSNASPNDETIHTNITRTFSSIQDSRVQSENNGESSFYEEMDLSEIDESTIVHDIIDLRKAINYNLQVKESVKTINSSSCISRDGVFVVVDTNIFLSNLSLLTQLREKQIPGLGQPTVVIPWMVIQELDYLKESHCSILVNRAARKAVYYINMLLSSKNPHFIGQSVIDASQMDMASQNPDDGILFCCLQLIKKEKYTILLSNDINLRNKALVNQIQAYGSPEIIQKLANIQVSSSAVKDPGKPVQKIKILLSNLLTHIIEKEMKQAYGDVWRRMALMHPPFTMEEALECLRKYWIAVFSFSLQKQCQMKIEEFLNFLKNLRNDSSFDEENYNKFVEYSLCLCIYLKNGYVSYRHLVSECIKNIQQCAE